MPRLTITTADASAMHRNPIELHDADGTSVAPDGVYIQIMRNTWMVAGTTFLLPDEALKFARELHNAAVDAAGRTATRGRR